MIISFEIEIENQYVIIYSWDLYWVCFTADKLGDDNIFKKIQCVYLTVVLIYKLEPSGSACHTHHHIEKHHGICQATVLIHLQAMFYNHKAMRLIMEPSVETEADDKWQCACVKQLVQIFL